MSDSRPPLHPALWVAAISVTVASMAGVVKMLGYLPVADAPPPEAVIPKAPSPQAEAPAPAPVVAPAPEKAAEKTLEKSAEPPHPAKPKPVQPHPAPISKPTTAHTEAPANPPPPQALAGTPGLPPPPSETQAAPPPPPAPTICRECGVVENIQAMQQKGEGSGIGAIGGAVLGGILGNQVGEGSGKKLARIGGAVLGGLAGNEVERQQRSSTQYQVVVRMEDGTRRVLTLAQPPSVHPGDPVRVRNGELIGGIPPGARSGNF